jgi:hypothetical protein
MSTQKIRFGIILENQIEKQIMKSLKISRYLGFFALMSLFIISCGNNPYGDKVKEPFQGSKYESNNRWFRAIGKGVSSKDNIAKSKADLAAKTELAGQVETTVKQVADQYLGEVGLGGGTEITDKFSSLSRQVMNTTIADLRKFDEEKFYNAAEGEYTVFIAYEIKKAAMFRFMKKQIKIDKKIAKADAKIMDDILDRQIKVLEAQE